jgi:PAS domain S-box-containing protein
MDPLKNPEIGRLLFLSHPQPMWVYDLETLAFLEVNNAAMVHYGYTREEFLAMTIRDIRPPEDIPRLLQNIVTVSQIRNSSA